ncbi:hypothetical protein MXB_3463, partial [Myxobolus squamalis]
SKAADNLSKILGRSKSRDFVNDLYDETSNIRKRKYSSSAKSNKTVEIESFSSENLIIDEEIEIKKKKLDNTEPNKYITGASEKAKQVNFLHSKIQESLAKHGLFNEQSMQTSNSFIDPNAIKIAVKLNDAGQTVDAVTGKPITLVQYTPTAKINVRAKRKQLAHAVTAEFKKTVPKPVEKSEEILNVENNHFDRRVKQFPAERARRDLKFHEPGKFTHLAHTVRTKLQLEKLQDKIQSIAKRTGIASATKLAMVTLKHEAETSGKTPEIEWWDTAILPSRSYVSFEKIKPQLSLTKIESDRNVREILQNFLAGITNLIEHPVPRLPPGEARDTATVPIYLTKYEQKKIRMQQRKQKERQKQENIILGVMPPPPPKVKMSNLMRVLGIEAVQDPTKVEAFVQQQIIARQKAHEDANAARKLTPAQKKAKLIKKYKEDISLAVHISVYRIWDISNRSKRFKVDKNAQQNFLTGCVIMFQDMNLVILEGGPKSQKRMKRLLLSRINWAEEVIHSNFSKINRENIGEPEIPLYNKCELVWEGTSGYRNFKEWTFKPIESEAAAREFLTKHHVDNYWDLACSLSFR